MHREPDRNRSSLPRLLAAVVLAAIAGVAKAGAPAPPPPVEVRGASVVMADGSSSLVTLPDGRPAAPAAAADEVVRYRLNVDFGAGGAERALYFPGLRTRARILVGGHVVDDTLGHDRQRPPHSIDAIRLIRVPHEFLPAAGEAVVEVVVAATRPIDLSRIWAGRAEALVPMRDRKVLLGVVGPLLVATTVGCLALVVLTLWVRRRSESIYGYFGAAALCWAGHTAWTVLPTGLLPGVHNGIWWTTLYSLFVALLVVFCIRFAGWHWPRFDRAVAVFVAAAPPVLYAAAAAGGLGTAAMAWRLALILLAVIGLVAVACYAWRRRNVDSALLSAAGVASVALGLRDWLTDFGDDNNPAYLTPYAGLLFLLLVAWMLVDRFVLATRELESLNRDLEQRVETKSLQLGTALEQMRSARDAAETANRAKSAFLAAASHDLRQPIHALGLYLATFGSARMSARQRSLVDRMGAALSSMSAMFGALLDVSRMDAGAVRVEPRSFALAPLSGRLLAEFEPLASEKGIRLALRVGRAGAGLHAWGDPLLIERVLRNLVGNAVKYTRRGGVLVAVRLRHREGRSHWRVEVWDSGIGIDAAEQQRVFEEFYQLGNAERERANGLGLGLAIVRRLVDLMAVPLALRSTPGRGSCFTLEVGTAVEAGCGEAPAVPAVARAASASRLPGSIAGAVVAVIEDDREVRDSMRLLLEHWGCITCEGADSSEVLARAQGAGGVRAQAIVADYRLREDRTGPGEIAQLRAVWGAQVPALLVSGDSAPACIAALHASGHPWLSKPAPAARLRSWLQAALALPPSSAGDCHP